MNVGKPYRRMSYFVIEITESEDRIIKEFPVDLSDRESSGTLAFEAAWDHMTQLLEPDFVRPLDVVLYDGVTARN